MPAEGRGLREVDTPSPRAAASKRQSSTLWADLGEEGEVGPRAVVGGARGDMACPGQTLKKPKDASA